MCRALVKIDKLDAWEDGIKHSINAAFAQLYGVKGDDDEDEENENMIKIEREKDAEEMEMDVVVDEEGRSMIVL